MTTLFAAGTVKGASFSPCRRYRYRLWRVWDDALPRVAFIGLNPSTADETADDPTIRRCLGFARVWGMGGLTMLNLFSFRATDPRDLFAEPEPTRDDDEHLIAVAGSVVKVVAAWGVHGVHRGRADAVRALPLGPLWCLGKTKDGHPRHPLYLPKTATLELL